MREKHKYDLLAKLETIFRKYKIHEETGHESPEHLANYILGIIEDEIDANDGGEK
jgi:hypothetical protein